MKCYSCPEEFPKNGQEKGLILSPLICHPSGVAEEYGISEIQRPLSRIVSIYGKKMIFELAKMGIIVKYKMSKWVLLVS